MPQFERIQKSVKRREREAAATTFPEEYQTARAHGGDEPDVDELLERIDRALTETTIRSLGRAADHE